MCFRRENSADIEAGFAYNHGNALLDNSCFLGGDFGFGVSQERGVVERNVCDYAQFRIYDVCAVKTPSKACFYNGHIYAHMLEVAEREYGGQFKKRGLHLFQVAVAEALYKSFDKGFVGHTAVNLYPFAEIGKVRGGVQAHTVTCGLQYGCYCVGGASFSVCAGYMYTFKFFMGIAHSFRQPKRGFKSGLVCSCSEILKHRHLLEEPFYRFLICHVNIGQIQPYAKI